MSNDAFELTAEFRDDIGKGASRRLRRTGKVPAVLYGGRDEPRAIALDHNQLVHHLDNEAFYSHVLTIRVGDKAQEAILKDLQRHPAKRAVLHADFQRIVAGEKIRMNVPLHFLGEDVAPGIKQSGGVLSKMINDAEITCLPKDLPEFLEVDVSALEIEEMVHLSDVKVPEGVELVELTYGEDHDQPVAAIHHARKAEDELEAEEAEAAAEEGGVVAEAPQPPTEEGD